jgi:hypothetical protein
LLGRTPSFRGPRAERDLRKARDRVVVLRRQLAKEYSVEQVAMKAVVLVEGESDRIAVETLAARRGRDLAAEGVAVIAVGGAHALERALRTLEAERVAGLYDRGEETAVRRGLDRAGVTPHGFFACDPDLEGELVRALGPERMLQLVEERGQLAAFRTYQRQPEKRSLSLEAQLHGWLHNWKVRYAAALVDALDLDRVPPPLDGVLAYV